MDCLGLGYCSGILQSDCCNYYSSEMCVTQCPEPLVADADFICGKIEDLWHHFTVDFLLAI